jgi:coenzyme F420-reducing hydrogenase alpha subunit
MTTDATIHIHHLTRVEGHGDITLDIKAGKIQKLQWQVVEAPRFFEAFVRGRHYNDLRTITSRICGICSIGHSLASLKATEDALNIKISEQTQTLRRLAINAENMQSHILHIGYLAAPDLLNIGSVIPLAGSKHHDTLLKIIQLHRLSNHMSDLICGRTTHPIRLVVGGFTAIPTPKQLTTLKENLQQALPTALDVATTLQNLQDKLPDFQRETEYIGLTHPTEYALYDGTMTSTDTGPTTENKNYQSLMKEYIVPQSTAKYAKHARASYMTNALARFNLNSTQLHPKAQDTAELFDLKAPVTNPFLNTYAQMVEFIHNIEDSQHQIDRLLTKGIKDEKPITATPKAGRGVGIVEVPRGILVHDYTLDKNGLCTKANCIIPTNQNHGNIQHDMEALVPTILHKSEKDIELTLEMLVRAYDPCISCSTHYLTVHFA